MRLPVSTLRSWFSSRILDRASRHPPLLSFWNLVEAHLLRSLRMRRGISGKAVRRALTSTEQEYGIKRLLLNRGVCLGAGRRFLDLYCDLTDVTHSGRITMHRLFEIHLTRVEWADRNTPVRLYPFLDSGTFTSEKSIVIDPGIQFGRPIVQRRGITTRIIAHRIDAGETIESVARDYDLTQAEVKQAILFDRAV